MIIDQLTPTVSDNLTDEVPVEQGTATFKTTWQKILNLFKNNIGLTASDISSTDGNVQSDIDDIESDISSIQADIGNIETLSTTYISNSYVTEANFNLLTFYRLGRLVIAYFNLNVTASPGATFRTIGNVNLPRSLMQAGNITLASQNDESTVLVNITSANGEIRIYTTGNASGFYRSIFPMLLS